MSPNVNDPADVEEEVEEEVEYRIFVEGPDGTEHTLEEGIISVEEVMVKLAGRAPTFGDVEEEVEEDIEDHRDTNEQPTD